MIAAPVFRASAFAIVALAVLAGLAARLSALGSNGPGGAERPAVVEAQPGQSVGSATLIDLVDKGAVRIAALSDPNCGEQIYAARTPIESVALEQVLDQNLLSQPGYAETSVYRGRAYRNFSRLDRLLARNPFRPSSEADGYTLRFYASSACAIADADYVEWAAILQGVDWSPRGAVGG